MQNPEDPKKEWEIERMRSSGPGGQHMQKTESKVRVRWYFDASRELSDEEKTRLGEAFPDGYIEAASQRTRSQRKNLEFAKQAIVERRDEALAPAAERIPTKIPRSAREARLEEKRRMTEKKSLRKDTIEFE